MSASSVSVVRGQTAVVMAGSAAEAVATQLAALRVPPGPVHLLVIAPPDPPPSAAAAAAAATAGDEEAVERPLATAQDYQMRWGNWTALAALLAAMTLGPLILGLLYHLAGEAWFKEYYITILGYYVCLAISMSHYFRSPKTPYPLGLLKHAVAVGGGIGLYNLHALIFSGVFGISAALIQPAHFTIIVISFFMFGMDDSFYRGALASWLKYDPLRAVFWYLVAWLIWAGVFLNPILVNGLAPGGFSPMMLNWYLASMQWVIMAELALAILWKEHMDTVDYGSNLRRGHICLFLALVVGCAMAFVCYGMFHVFFSGELSPSGLWHHVLYTGTFPLNPMFAFGLYTNRLQELSQRGWSPLSTCIARSALVFVLTIIGYFFFHLAVAPTGLLGLHPWAHHQDLVFNFTTSIVMVTHHWFASRWGFVVLKDAAAVREEGPFSLCGRCRRPRKIEVVDAEAGFGGAGPAG